MRFRNPSGVDMDGQGLGRWVFDRVRRRLPRPPRAPITGVAPDLAFLHANRTEPSATWIGHATVLLQVGGVNLLTDPVFSRWVTPLPPFGPRRHQPPGIALRDLPRVDVVLLSHAHYDHCDRPSLRALAAQAGGPPLFLVPEGLDLWLAKAVPAARGHVHALAWDASHAGDARAPGLAFHFHPVQHWSNRSPLRRNDTAWGSWAILHDDLRFWFSGDLGYSGDPARIGERHGHFDWAAIAIGAYEPRWFMAPQHVNPAEAVQVMRDVRAARAFGIHWGTFPLTDEPLDQPPRDLADAVRAAGLAADAFTAWRHGEVRRLPRAARGTAGAAGTP